MYRANPPPHLLFQGDILVVPRVELEIDPALRRLEKRLPPPPDKCGTCGHQEPQGKPTKEWTQHKWSRRVAANEEISGDIAHLAHANVHPTVAVLLTHSCDLDSGDQFVFATVWPIERCNEKARDEIRSGTAPRQFFYLEPSPRLPEAVINLELQFSLSHKHLGTRLRYESRAKKMEPALVPFREVTATRFETLDEKSLEALYKRLLDQLTRPKEIKFDRIPVGDSVYDNDPNRPQTEMQQSRGWWWPTPSWAKAKSSANAELPNAEPEQSKMEFGPPATQTPQLAETDSVLPAPPTPK